MIAWARSLSLPELTIVGYLLLTAFALVNAGMSRITAFYGATLTSNHFVLGNDGHGGSIVDFTSATSLIGGHGQSNAIASPVTS